MGGIQRTSIKLAAEFRRRGYPVDLVIVDPAGPLLESVPPDVRVVGLGSSRARHAIGKLRSYLRRERPEAILSFAFQANLLTMIASLWLRPKPRIILSVRNAYTSAMRAIPRPKRYLYQSATRFLYRWADGVVAISRGMAADLNDRAGIPKDLIHVIYNPVIEDGYEQPTADQSENITNEPGLALILTVGRLVPQKDQATLIRAFARVAAKHPAKLLIIGEGELYRELEYLAESLEVRDRVEFAGFKGDPRPFMRAADLFVLSSAWEGFGNVLVEAMAMGTPVVATDCPHGPREILEDGRWGTLVPVGDPNALAEAILEALMGGGIDASARARRFTVERAATEYLNVLLGRHVETVV